MTALLADVAPGVVLPRGRSRWAPGSVTGSVAGTALVAAEGVDTFTATQAPASAVRSLAPAGWHVLAREEGMPRVLAGRGGTDDEPLRRELQVVYVAARGRYAVSHRCGSFVVGHAAVQELLGRNLSGEGA